MAVLDGASALFQVINQRYLKSSTILATNAGITNWQQLSAMPPVAAAMLDRLLHRRRHRYRRPLIPAPLQPVHFGQLRKAVNANVS